MPRRINVSDRVAINKKTPNESRPIGFVRVIHAHHPLNGQIVKVLRQAGHAAYSERRWIVMPPYGQPGGIPWSWAVPIENYTTEQGIALESDSETLLAGVTELLNLARMVQAMSVDQPGEVAHGHGSGTISGAAGGIGSPGGAVVGAAACERLYPSGEVSPTAALLNEPIISIRCYSV